MTAQTAAVSAHTLVLVASAFTKGMWRIGFVATQTTAGSTGTVLGGTTGFTITFTNENVDTVSKTELAMKTQTRAVIGSRGVDLEIEIA